MPDNVLINGVNVTDANFNDTTPVASAGRELMLWQRSGSGPDSISAQTSANVPVVLNRAMTDLTIVNTTTETTLYSFSVPANAMSTNRGIHVTVLADVLQNTLASTATFRVKFGGTTIFADATGSYANGAARRAWFFDFWIGNQNATNDQAGGGIYLPQDITAVTAPTTGIAGDFSDSSTDGSPIIVADAAIDTTAAQTLGFTWQWTSAGAATEFRRRMAIATLY